MIGGIDMHGSYTLEGMVTMVLYVPRTEIVGKTPMDIQADLGLPWAVDDGSGIWFDEVPPGLGLTSPIVDEV